MSESNEQPRANRADDEPPGDNDRIARTSSYYDRFGDDVARRIERRDFTRAFDSFSALAIPGRTILDIGSGGGAHLAELARRGFRAIGIEPSARMRQLSQEQGLEVIDGSFERLGQLGLEPAGGVWCAASLLHVPLERIPSVLTAIHDVMAPGAPLYATVRLGSGASWDRYDDDNADEARFIQLFDDGELTAMIETAGFAVLDEWIEESTWGRPSRWASILARRPA